MYIVPLLFLALQNLKLLLSNTIICDGTDNGSCPLYDIVCMENEDCVIICSSDNICMFKTIQCPSNHHCELHCINPNSLHQCLGISIDATNSLSLLINASMGNVSDPQTMDEAQIYCPINTESTEKPLCNIHCDGNDLMPRVEIYALHGFDDISIQTISYQDTCHAGISIYCGDGFTSTCIMTDEYPYRCSSSEKSQDTTCDPTRIETISPSMNPSGIPTYGTSEYKDTISTVIDIETDENQNGRPEWILPFCIGMGVLLICLILGLLCLWRNKLLKRKVEETELNAIKHQSDHEIMDKGTNIDGSQKSPLEGSPLMTSEDD